MSRDYNIRVSLDADLSVHVLKTILMRGLELKWLYLNESLDHQIAGFNAFLSVDEAINVIMLGVINPKDLTHLPTLTIKIAEIYVFLTFGNYEGAMHLLLSPAGNNRYKGDPDEKNLDFEYYIRLLLGLVEGFTILELKTFDDGWQDHP